MPYSISMTWISFILLRSSPGMKKCHSIELFIEISNGKKTSNSRNLRDMSLIGSSLAGKARPRFLK